ncbi:MAG TPA: aryl-sulfate sulfotransferase [bacterium]|nr:aryl-sulfate sulfotransferase [bacterium]
MKITFAVIFILLSALYGCGKDQEKKVEIIFGTVERNPSSNVPLSAQIEIKTSVPVSVEVTVLDIDREREGFVKEYKNLGAGTLKIPVLGLFPDHENEVAVKINGNAENTRVFKIKTDPLPDDLPLITIEGKIESGWTIANWIRYPGGNRNSIALAFDELGRTRWYTTLPDGECTPVIVKNGLFYCSNLNEYFKAYDFMGFEAGSWDMDKKGFFGVHHDIFIKDNGNILVLPNMKEQNMIEDFVMEIEPLQNKIVKLWDLKKFFPDVQDLYGDLRLTDSANPENTSDPIHVNGVWYDSSDNTIIVSSQTAGVMKISYDDRIVWYIAPQITAKIDDADGDGVSDSKVDGYDAADDSTYMGDIRSDAYVQVRRSISEHEYDYGFDFNYMEFILRPVDNEGQFISDKAVLNGFENGDTFAWSFRSHSPVILKNGNLMVFDNGLARNFRYPVIERNSYSRAVEYEIIEDADGCGGTIRQAWEYKLDDTDPSVNYFSPYVSNVSELENGNRLIVSGSIGISFVNYILEGDYEGFAGALLVEVDPSDNSVKNSVFMKRAGSDLSKKAVFSVYRAYRFELEALLPENRN